MNFLSEKKIIVYYTDHFINRTITQFLAKSNNLDLVNCNYYKKSDDTFVSYGILRGNEEKFKNSKKFIYIDHGFMASSNRRFLPNKSTHLLNFDGYFRIIKDDYYFNKNYFNLDPRRFNELNISLKDLCENGDYIILSEPSKHTLNFLNIPNWTEQTVKLIEKYTDRKIIIHNKFSETSLNELLKNAFAFISCQSTAAFKAIAEGVPSYFTHETLKNFGAINNIEDRKLNYDLLYAASNSQWKLSEFFDDDFKLYLSKILN